MEEGKFYLISSPWFWTTVSRFLRYVNFQEIEVADAIYFTRTGATFDVLATAGLVLSGERKSLYYPLPGKVLLPSQGLKIPWLAPAPWVKK